MKIRCKGCNGPYEIITEVHVYGCMATKVIKCAHCDLITKKIFVPAPYHQINEARILTLEEYEADMIPPAGIAMPEDLLDARFRATQKYLDNVRNYLNGVKNIGASTERAAATFHYTFNELADQGELLLREQQDRAIQEALRIINT